MTMRTTRIAAGSLAGLGLSFVALAWAGPAGAQYQQKIANDMSQCQGAGPAVRVNISGIKAGTGTMRVQIYRATKADWMVKSRWMYRIEAPARQGAMSFCLPVPRAGSYGVAVRHDLNGNGDTDIFADGGGISNNPSVNIFNLGKPSYTKAAFNVGDNVTTISIRMRYM